MRTRAVMAAMAAGIASVVLSTGASASPAPASGAVPATGRVFRPVGMPQVGHAPNAPTAGSSVNLQYMGGSVLRTPKAFVIFWGPEWNTGFSSGGFTNTQAKTYVDGFFTGVGGSSWINSTTQYCQGIALGSQFCPAGSQSVSNPANQFGGAFVDTTAVPRRPTDAQVRAAAQPGASHFGYSADALYLVFTPHNKSISGFGTQ